MAPKGSRNAQEDSSKAETPAVKEKSGSGSGHRANGKMQRVASSTGSNLREVTNAAAAAATTAAASATATSAPAAAPEASPGLQWPAFEREVLHAYRRVYRLNTPTAFSRDYHQWVLTQSGSIGLYSPTIARKKEFRRQTNDQLTGSVRKHFNSLGVQENDVIVDFLHKIRNGRASKPSARKKTEPPPAATNETGKQK